MRINHLVQVDVRLRNGFGRFWMDTCGGRDQIAMAVLKEGWQSYESPMPRLISTWSEAFSPVFVDVGANTGFYSLLALASGATFAHAFEPVREISDIYFENARTSEVLSKIKTHLNAVSDVSGEEVIYFPLSGHGLVETSASLNKGFRAKHSAQRKVSVVTLDEALPVTELNGSSVILKLDVESREAAVLRGAEGVLSAARPIIFAELLPGNDHTAFLDLCERHGYRHYSMSKTGLADAPKMVVSLEQRDHLFLPIETASRWLQELG
jgi:FkbM family methyltransferase